MSGFWDSFIDATDMAIGTLGEPVLLDGEEITAIADPLAIEEMKSAGGRKTMLAGDLVVAAGTELRDGMPVRVRGKDGRVESWEALAADGPLVVRIGPVNRWSGEIPGA
jgi:hypothetical protein